MDCIARRHAHTTPFAYAPKNGLGEALRPVDGLSLPDLAVMLADVTIYRRNGRFCSKNRPGVPAVFGVSGAAQRGTMGGPLRSTLQDFLRRRKNPCAGGVRAPRHFPSPWRESPRTQAH